jgi:hypothetical protein
MTERYSRDPHPRVIDRIAVWVFPWLDPEPPDAHAQAETEPEAGQ